VKYDFPAACRLKKEKDIKAVLARQDIFRGKRLIFYRAENNSGQDGEADKIHRFCIMAPRKCGNAARRNRIKRIIREILRINRYRIEVGYDYIIRIDPAGVANQEIRQELFIGDFECFFGWN